jgi:hypothetical protein
VALRQQSYVTPNAQLITVTIAVDSAGCPLPERLAVVALTSGGSQQTRVREQMGDIALIRRTKVKSPESSVANR